MNVYHVIFDGKLAVVQAPDELTARALGLKMLQREGKTRCSVDVERLLERLKDEGIDGLMLDLRNTNALLFVNSKTGSHNMVYLAIAPEE